MKIKSDKEIRIKIKKGGIIQVFSSETSAYNEDLESSLRWIKRLILLKREAYFDKGSKKLNHTQEQRLLGLRDDENGNK